MTVPLAVLCVDRVKPTVALTNPTSGGGIGGIATLSANAADNDKVTQVDFYIDSNHIGSDTSAPYQLGYDTHALTAGAHTFTAIATDRVGNQGRTDITATVTNSTPGAGQVTLGEWQPSDGGGGYVGGSRTGPIGYDGTQGDWIWSNTGQKIGYLNLPGNPDPTHYTMRAWLTGTRIEPGSAGNVIYVDILVSGTWYNAWANGGLSGFFGPIVNVGGGDQVGAKRWCTIEGVNAAFCQGIGIYYDFVINSGYQS